MKLTPNENGDNKNELVALGYSHQQNYSGCLGNTPQFLGLLLHWLNHTNLWEAYFSMFQEGQMDFELQRGVYLVINLSLPATKHIGF